MTAMGFFKRNISFVLLMAAALVTVAALVFLFAQKRIAAKQKEDKVQEQISSFEAAERGSYSINAANLAAAKSNRTRTDKAVQDFVDTLVERYSFPPEKRTGLECVQILRDECAAMQKALAAKGVAVAATAVDFSFDPVFKSTTPPAESDTPQLLKQLRIISEIMAAVGPSMGSGSQVLRVNRLTPSGARPLKDGLYSVETFEVAVSGTDTAVQKLLNSLQGNEAKGIFIVRSVDIQELVSVGDEKGPRTPVRPGSGPVAGRGAAKSGALVKENPAIEKKDDRIFLSPRDIQAVLLVDLVEFENTK